MEWYTIDNPPPKGEAVDLWVQNGSGGDRFPDMTFVQGDHTQQSDWHGDMICLSDCGYTLEDVTHWMRVVPPVLPTAP